MATVRRTAALRALWQVVYLARRQGAAGVREHLRAVPRMVAMGFTGRYPHLGKGRVALVVLAVVYVLSPVDLVPELVLPLLGLGDDAVVLTWALGALLAETATFLDWERARREVIIGDVVG